MFDILPPHLADQRDFIEESTRDSASGERQFSAAAPDTPDGRSKCRHRADTKSIDSPLRIPPRRAGWTVIVHATTAIEDRLDRGR
ncbi:hypothetical protein ACFYV7_35565 [Nocardia suismassiliense]|uniref:Uncharacterized protein n=1 Tax=Nocardia suismassiliense TaxID=2077092 RepID=A0ABW6R3X5_9NOCA